MKITIAKTAGFCMGVQRAVDMAIEAANTFQDAIFTYGPLIHNPQILAMLESKKILRIDKIPKEGRGIVLIRAHGVPPEDEKALKRAGFRIINATCPRVTRVQVIIDTHSRKKYSIIIVGDRNHPEVIGLLGYTRGTGKVISSLEELKRLPRYQKGIIVAQTTQNISSYEEIKFWCQENTPHYKIFDTICDSTEQRQFEVIELAEKNDAIIVVGGKESGNTKRLAQVAADTGTPTYYIESPSELNFLTLACTKSIAITAGASTPNWVIKNICDSLRQELQNIYNNIY